MALLILVIQACNKEEIKIGVKTESRTISGIIINSRSATWIDSFRQNIYENIDSDYSVNDGIDGMDFLLNIYKTQGIGNFKQYAVNTYEYEIPLLLSGKMTTSALRDFFEDVYFNNKELYLNSTLDNKIFGEIKLEILSANSSLVKVLVTTIIGSNDTLHTTDSYIMAEDESYCQPTFNETDCFYAGFGDADYYNNNFGLLFGGDCNGNKIGNIAAHEEVQKKFTKQIPTTVIIKEGKNIASNAVKFVVQNCVLFNISGDVSFYNTYIGCSNDLLNDDVFYNITKYDNEALDCAYCIVNNWVRETIPSGYDLCFMNIWTDQLLTGTPNNNDIKWLIEICWGTPILVPISPVLTVGDLSPVEAESIITNPDPYDNLGMSIPMKLGL